MREIKEKAILQIGNSNINIGFYDMEIASEFIKQFPLSLVLEQAMNREYCSDALPFVPVCKEHNQTFFEVGDLAYWKKGNAFAFFYAEGISQEVPSGIVVLGKILSDLSIFRDMPASIKIILKKQ